MRLFRKKRKPDKRGCARSTKRGALRQICAAGFSPAVVFDIGAQVGTRELYEEFPDARHILIEPVADNEKALQDICKGLRHAEYLIAAATSVPGEIQLRVTGNAMYSRVVETTDAGETDPYLVENFPEIRRIRGVTIDGLCREKKLSGPFLLKIDVDGSEIEVLKGCVETLKETEYLVIEATLMNGQLITDIILHMRGAGFDLYDIVDLEYRPQANDLWQVDLAFIRKGTRLLPYTSYLPPGELGKVYG